MSTASAGRRAIAAWLSVAALLGACRDDAGESADAPTELPATTPDTGAPGSSTSTQTPATPRPGASTSTAGSASTGSAPGTAPPTGVSTSPSGTPASTASTGGTGSTAVTGSSGASPAGGFLEAAGTAASSFPGTNRMAVLTDVRTGRQDGFDRVVFEFQPGDELPGYLVGYQDLPLRADPSDEPLSIRGEVALVVRMQAASRFRFEDATLVYRGPPSVALDGTAITEVVLRGDFEALLSWAIGSTGRRPYRVGTLEGPPRIYVDIAT